MSGDARPAELAFRSPLPQEEPELVRWRADGGPEHGTLGDVADYYRSLDRGRLVVLGEPGAGKTVLATQLVIDLIEALPDSQLQPGARPPVPVWLSLTSIDLGEADALARASADQIAAQLNGSIIAQLSAVYQIPRLTAKRLLDERWVLPVLDALDEMDAPNQDANTSDRPRAAAVVRALNAGTGRRPVVLVCRRGEYGQMARTASAGGEDPVLQDASQIVLQPLDVAAIRDYLTRRFPAGRSGNIAPRWENVVSVLEGTMAPRQTNSLIRVLSSPWRLFLAATAYQDDKSDPEELIWCPADGVDEYLLSQLIPAVTRRIPRPNGVYYSSAEVQIWLSNLAGHLYQSGPAPQFHWSSTDLRLEQLWPIAGQKVVQRLSILAYIVILSAVYAVPGLVWVHINGRWYPNNAPNWVGVIGAIMTILGVLAFSVDPHRTLHRFDLRSAFTASRKKLVAWLVGGAVSGAAFGLAFAQLASTLKYGYAGGLPVSTASGVATGLAVGLGAGLAFGLRDKFSLATQPTSVMRQNITYAATIGLLGSLISCGAGLPSVLHFAQKGELAGGTVGGLMLSVAAGLAVGLTIAVLFGLDTWIRYMIGCWLAWRKGMLPRRVGQFLDWGYRGNLLRMSGTAVQFRHRELQAWVTQNRNLFLANIAREGRSLSLQGHVRRARPPGGARSLTCALLREGGGCRFGRRAYAASRRQPPREFRRGPAPWKSRCVACVRTREPAPHALARTQAVASGPSPPGDAQRFLPRPCVLWPVLIRHMRGLQRDGLGRAPGRGAQEPAPVQVSRDPKAVRPQRARDSGGGRPVAQPMPPPQSLRGIGATSCRSP